MNKFDIVLRAGRWWERAWLWFRAHILRRPLRIKSVEILNPNSGMRLMDTDEPYFIDGVTIDRHIPGNDPNWKPFDMPRNPPHQDCDCMSCRPHTS